MSNIKNAIHEINNISFNSPSDWLKILKASAIDAIYENDASLIDDDIVYCELPKTEYEKFKAAIKREAYFHDDWDEVNLERRIVRLSKEYVDAYNEIVGILLKYGVDKVSHRWLETPTDSDELINEFCNYELPEGATVDGSWDLPDTYDDLPDAPDWKFSFSEFSGFIKSVTKTDDPNQVKVEYYIYRRNSARGLYEFWNSGKARVDIKTHRRWNVE